MDFLTPCLVILYQFRLGLRNSLLVFSVLYLPINCTKLELLYKLTKINFIKIRIVLTSIVNEWLVIKGSPI